MQNERDRGERTHPTGGRIAGVVIRRARPEDWPAVEGFLAAQREAHDRSRYFPEGVRPAVEIGVSEDADAATLVATADADARVVGLASWRRLEKDHAAEARLIVGLGWAVHRLGRALLEATVEDARRNGVRVFRVPVEPWNAALRAAARELGLRESRFTNTTHDEVELALPDRL